MKKLLTATALLLACFGAKSQTIDFLNHGACEFEVRAICINNPPTSHTVVSGWTTIPAGPPTPVMFSHPGCGAGTVAGYEVRYSTATGCSSSVFFSTDPSSTMPYSPGHNNPGPCPCSPNPNGPDMDLSPGIIDIVHIQH